MCAKSVGKLEWMIHTNDNEEAHLHSAMTILEQCYYMGITSFLSRNIGRQTNFLFHGVDFLVMVVKKR